MKRLFCCLLAASMLLSVLSGCGNSTAETDSVDTLLLATTQMCIRDSLRLFGRGLCAVLQVYYS